MWNAVRYVERNPVRAGLVERAEDYPWSSAAAHCGLRADPLPDKDFPPAGLVPDWAASGTVSSFRPRVSRPQFQQ